MTINLPPNLKVFLLPLGLIAVLGILTAVLVNVGLSQINTQRATIENSKKEVNVLKTKQAVLTDAQASILGKTDASVIAMPQKNPALTVSAQMKKLAEAKSLMIEDFKISNQSAGQAGISEVGVTFSLAGSLPSILDFIKGISSIAPVMTLEKISFSGSGPQAKVEVAVKAYWADFPESLTQITQAIPKLSDDDQKVLDKLSSLTQPPFGSLTPQQSPARADPFSF